jgi:hypothetical protein
VKLLIGSAENTVEIQARKKEKQGELTLKPVTYLGPVHWYTTAKILQNAGIRFLLLMEVYNDTFCTRVDMNSKPS